MVLCHPISGKKHILNISKFSKTFHLFCRIIFFRRHKHRTNAEGVLNIPPNHSSIPSINDKIPEHVSAQYSVNKISNRPSSNASNPVSQHSATAKWKLDSSTSSLREIESEIEQAVQVDRAQHHARRQRLKPKRAESIQTTIGTGGGVSVGGNSTRYYKHPFLQKYLHRRSASLFLFSNRKQHSPSNVETVVNTNPITGSRNNDEEHTAHSF